MKWFLSFYRSALGKKTVMAITGIMLFGFVFVHMVGNLKVYMGPGTELAPAAINEYAEFLREVGHPLFPHGVLLWVARLALLAAVGLHMMSALQLTRLSQKARPQDYKRRDVVQATYAARTVRWGGVIIALFVFYHLAHFTWGWAHHSFVPGDVYRNLVEGFKVPWVSGIYIVAQLALGLHLYHGLWSMFQTLGLHNGNPDDWRRKFALAFAVIVAAGNISFPISVLTGLIS